MLIYDIEIANAIPDSRNPRQPDITYCSGWSDYQGMGIAVIGCYDYATDRMRVFCQDNLIDFGTLAVTSDCVVGFNSHRFDNRILAANHITILPEKSYDILEEVWRGLGLGPDFRPETHGGYSLEALCRANFGKAKTGNGALAPIWWQRGGIGSVVDYCLQDITLTKKLLDRIIRAGFLTCPKTQSPISIRKPGSVLSNVN